MAAATIRRYFLHLEESWTLLARSEEFAERPDRFCANRRGPASKMLLAEMPGSRKAGRHSGRVRNELIAIVDDNQCARDGIDALIASLGYTSATFMSAEEYLRSECKQRTACLILDVHLPGMSGPDLQARLIADGDRTPIVFVTALLDERVRGRVIEAGALGYLSKPFDENALISCLVQAFGR
jgi:CheY-like chemotaxis protein